MDSETRIRQALSILSKDPEKRYVERSPIRNRQLHFLENLDWYYIPPTQTFRRRVYEYASFDLGGTPGHQNPLRGFQTPCPLPPFGGIAIPYLFPS